MSDIHADNIYTTLPTSISGLGITYASATTLTVATGVCRDSTNTSEIVASSALTINSAVNGVNGLDTGTIAAADTYAVFVISSGRGYKVTAALISLSATAPTLPTGYDTFRRIGWTITSSSNFLKIHQTGKGEFRTYYHDAIVSVLANGVDTSYTDIDLSTAVPAINTNVILHINTTPAAPGDLTSFRPGGSTSSTAESFTSAAIALSTMQAKLHARLVSGVPTIEYKTIAAGDVDVFVVGFEDYL